MSAIQFIYLSIIFVIIFAMSLLIMRQFVTTDIELRLKQISDSHKKSGETSLLERLLSQLNDYFPKLQLPESGWENSKWRIRFMHAGFRNPSALIFFFALKILIGLGLTGLVILFILISGRELSSFSITFSLIIAASVGFFLPNFCLSRIIARRKREIFESFPDVLDLTTICVEAGLGLDAALSRVGHELMFKKTILGEELHLLNLELRAGSSREHALRNLALRTGVEEIATLVVILVQSDRFGTSVAESLRVHSNGLREKRRMKAEEAAAKIPLKLLFPLIFCIFPSLLTVLLGPAFISIGRTLMPSMGL